MLADLRLDRGVEEPISDFLRPYRADAGRHSVNSVCDRRTSPRRYPADAGNPLLDSKISAAFTPPAERFGQPRETLRPLTLADTMAAYELFLCASALKRIVLYGV
jgi:hypothetical protein